MLFAILKALGLDVPARINALKADFDQRVQATSSQVSQTAQHAAVLAVLFTLAAIAALLACGVVLIAIFWWVADAYGVYAGLAVVFAILVLAAAVLAMMARARGKSLAVSAAKTPRAMFATTSVVSDAGAVSRPTVVAPPVAAFVSSDIVTPSASEVVEPLAVLLKGFGSGRPMVAELLGNIGGGSAPGPVNMALDRATNVIRHGDRANLLTVLTGAAVVGWLLVNQSRRK